MATPAGYVSGNNSANPAASVSGTSTVALADGESVFLTLSIPNDNVTGLTCTVSGVAATETGRMTRTGAGTTVQLGYKNTTGSSIASGATVSAAWTNTGTQNGGGATLSGGKSDGVVDPTAPAATGTGGGLSQAPTATSGAPPSSTKDYIAVSSLGGFGTINAAGQATPPAGYTAFPEGYQSTRLKAAYSAAVVRTAPVSAETAAWTVTWGANKQWGEVVGLFELAAAGITITAPPASLTLGAPVPGVAEAANAPPAAATLSAPAPTLAETVLPPAARVDLPAPPPAVALVVAAVPATLTLNAAAPSISETLTATSGTLTLSAPTPSIPVPLVVTAPPATITLSAAAPAISSFTLPNLAAVRYFTAPHAHLRTFLSPAADTDELASPFATVRAR